MTKTTKKCTVCHEVKPSTAFHRRKASKDGLQPACIECRREQRVKYAERERERQRRRRLAEPTTPPATTIAMEIVTYIPGAIIIETIDGAAEVRTRDCSAEIRATSNAVTVEVKDQEGKTVETHHYLPLHLSSPGITAREILRNVFPEPYHQDELPWPEPVKMKP